MVAARTGTQLSSGEACSDGCPQPCSATSCGDCVGETGCAYDVDAGACVVATSATSTRLVADLAVCSTDLCKAYYNDSCASCAGHVLTGGAGM